MKTLYRKNSFGVGRWCIWSEGQVIKFGHSSSLDGSLIVSEEFIEEGKAGRSLQEQIQSRIDSRVSKMLDKGYKDTADEAAKAITNQLGLITPMLAKPLKASKIKPSYIQPKLNGHRCLATNIDGDLAAYSRQGKLITSIEHIVEQLRNLPDGITTDGELYIHGMKLQSIASLVKRKQVATRELEYHIYDCVIRDKPNAVYEERLATIEDLFRNHSGPVVLSETSSVSNLEQAQNVYEAHISAGFEGSMLRDPNSRYENGKRSSGLLKMKPLYDTEVEVLDIIPGETGLGICVCRLEGLDRTFKVLAPGTHDAKRRALEDKAVHIGMRLKIEYRELTADGVPFHAVATEWYSSI